MQAIVRNAYHSMTLACALAVTTAGCNWINSRSDFERDPFVMSHLTKGSESSLAADDAPVRRNKWSWTPASRSGDASPVQTASLSKDLSSEKPSRSHDPNYSWISGRLKQRRGVDSGWYVQYGKPGDQDRYGGELSLEDSPKLGLIREGDRVLLEGELLSKEAAEPRFRIHKLALLD